MLSSNHSSLQVSIPPAAGGNLEKYNLKRGESNKIDLALESETMETTSYRDKLTYPHNSSTLLSLEMSYCRHKQLGDPTD